MLSSLLERSSNKIRLDRVIVESEEELVLFIEEEEVQQEVKTHFMKQFRKRQLDNSKFTSKWIKAYRPIDEINEKIYSTISEEVTEQEWQEVLRGIKSKSAPGTSGISYPLIKKTSNIARLVFIALASKCIQKGDIPVKWKIGQLYPIPKGENWNYNLSNVRPIILLEAFRKVVVRVIGKRLDKVLTKFNVLKGPNFAGLSGSSTSSPIHIMNNLVEEAR